MGGVGVCLIPSILDRGGSAGLGACRMKVKRLGSVAVSQVPMAICIYGTIAVTSRLLKSRQSVTDIVHRFQSSKTMHGICDKVRTEIMRGF